MLANLKSIFWPIERHELKKFLPMALMMCFILFNYSMMRSIKDAFVVTGIGTEALGFLKTYLVLPSAVLFVIIYVKLCNIFSQQKVFYIVTSFFAGYLALFTFFLYPNMDAIHPSPEFIDSLSNLYPNFKWFIRIAGKWSLATFYIMSELWGSVMLSLLFWQFANQITKTSEAKRFYSMFGMLGNVGLIMTSVACYYFLERNILKLDLTLIPVLTLTIISSVLLMFTYYWIQCNVLTDPRLYSPEEKTSKKKKVKLSMVESFKLIVSSKYLGLIATLIIAYGVSLILVEAVWKDKIRQLYPLANDYAAYMGRFQGYQGVGAILFMILGNNILRLTSWSFAASLTPLMMLVTGMGFFGFIFFDKFLMEYLTFLAFVNPLAIAVAIGMIQNILGKSTKYSLFDSTKEMSYIPLDDELKSKGKAAVDVIGGRLGKSGGGVITSSFFIFMPTLTFLEATPYFALIFFGIVVIWLYAVSLLGKEYNKALKHKEEEQKA